MEKKDLTQGKVFPVLLALAVPIMGSSFLQFIYNLVDMLFVGKLGSDAIASVGCASFFIGLGHAINALVIIGTGIKVSHEIGRNEVEVAKGYIQQGMLLNGVFGVFYALLLIIGGRSLIGFLTVNQPFVENEGYLYLAWSGPMLFFAFYNGLFSRILGSLGNTQTALKISVIGVVTNIIMDPILIYGMKWGVQGASIATLLAQVVMFILYVKVGKEWFKFRSNKIEWHQVKEIIQLGTPMACQRVLFTGVNIYIARFIAPFGAAAIAAQKLGLQIESVTYMVTGGLNGAVASFTGQNYGASNVERIKKGYRVALIFACIYAGMTTLLFIFGAEFMIRAFVDEMDTIVIAKNYLSIIAVSQLFNALEMVSNGMFTGLGKPKIPATVSMIFTLLRLPMASLLIPYLGLNGIWWSITFSTVLKGLTLVVIYALTNSKLKVVH